MSIVKDILAGFHDDELDAIRTALSERRKMVRKADAIVNMSEISVGDTVRLKDIRPKDANGELGKVTSKRRTKLVVELLRPVGRFGVGPVIVPASCVELVEGRPQ